MPYAYAIQVLREDGSEVAQHPVRVDWEPARETLRLAALELGLPAETAFLLECELEPVWDPTRGRPFVSGMRGRTPGHDLEAIFPAECFGEAARVLTRQLVTDEVVQKGDLIRCLPLAFPEATSPVEADGVALTRRSRPVAPRLTVRPGSLREIGADPASAGPLPVFIPQQVLDQAAQQTTEHPGAETGGILIGNLRRDPTEQRLFLEVTAQIPARHTEASSARLTFTPATWTDVQSALTLRHREEVMLGWWHSHPVREWCKECPPEKRATCALAQGFLSEDDRLLHRTMFPRAYSIALLANDAEEGLSWSLFGWSRGLIAPRNFTPLQEPAHARV